MGPLTFPVTTLICGVIWLALLVVTQFNTVAVSAGLLAAVVATGRDGLKRPM